MRLHSLALLLVSVLLANLQTVKAQKVVLHMTGNQTFECNISQLDSIKFTTQKVSIHLPNKQLAEYSTLQLDSITFIEGDSSESDDTTDPSITGDAIDITNKSATLIGYATSIRDNLANDLRIGFIYCLEGTPGKNNGTQVEVPVKEVTEDGQYFATLTNLLSNTIYYFRSFIYQSGLWFYGKVKSFMTNSVEGDFNTGDATAITCFSAKVSGSVNIQSSYLTLEYGICYGTRIEPTINNNKLTATSENFTLQLRQLYDGTVYYYRTYAIIDGQAYYGTVRTFRTLDDNVVETGTIDEKTLTVTSHITIGGGAYSSLVLGVCYGKTETPTVNDKTVTTDEVDDENNYTVTLVSPGYGTIYYRAYVLIDGIPHYGNVKSFENDFQSFDQWLYENFFIPYNVDIKYRIDPSDNIRSQLLAHFIKYLFYDVYTKFTGSNFLKKYGPRIIQFIGSKAYSPTTDTETLGYASGGVKITLVNVNEMKLWTPETPYSAADIERLNEYQFHTMHHEFSHILHQTKSYPVNFGQITPADYDGRDWQERDSVLSHSLGFITHYASSATYEDFVETLSCTITDTDCRWMYTIIDACANGGVKEGDKELVYELIDSLQIAGLDEPNKPWNRFKILKETSTDSETGEETERFVPSFHQTDAKANAENAVTYEDETSYMTFREYLDTWVQVDNDPETKGMNAILKKLEIAQKWYTEKWGLYLFQIRKEVKARQSKINEYVRDNVTIYDL